ncbi:digestive cysteine proteinase 1 [Toxorhynchites rutilus septentrionalis]|uniref:digestive cysteine proteinase 1 n=1 Tax=Toxorhynchites rutilus septentrionalis TaxID=329112 RepID=UPI002479D9D7|nr:digestive cysteine proteinase 1 [Toxorhynchites rutilus septentrionalis]
MLRLFTVVSCFVVAALGTNPPRWPKVYSASGVLNIPYAEISEPFYAWHDSENGRSRIDYYGGMVKTYQLTKEGDYGTSLKVAPITTKQATNKDTCLQVNGTSDMPVTVQSILPDAKKFKLAGTETRNGFKCDKFTLIDDVGQKRNVYNLWVRYIKSPKYPASRMPIPVRYEMKGYNTLLGSHYDHYYLDYDSYEHQDIPADVFDVQTIDPCVGFPGPGNGHYTTFNPMQEFIHPRSEEHLDNEFSRFKNKHSKSYDSEKEHDRRRDLFRQNLRFIHSHNRANKGFTVTVNHLADRTDEELKALRGFKSSNTYNGGQPFPYKVKDLVADLPESLDWRISGAVTPVKDQSVCGSCWSFGTTGHIESSYFLKTNKLVRLSQQALIDCSWGYGNNGCDGGEDFRAYQWMMEVGGIPSEEEYGGYLGQDGYCRVENQTLYAPITGWVNVTSGDADAMKVALFKHGPLSIAIDAGHKTFSYYANGIYYDPECKNKLEQLDHAVLAVGYGKLNGEDYWLIKNSWSNYWGNDGYALMAMKDNNCGITTDATYVLM